MHWRVFITLSKVTAGPTQVGLEPIVNQGRAILFTVDVLIAHTVSTLSLSVRAELQYCWACGCCQLQIKLLLLFLSDQSTYWDALSSWVGFLREPWCLSFLLWLNLDVMLAFQPWGKAKRTSQLSPWCFWALETTTATLCSRPLITWER